MPFNNVTGRTDAQALMPEDASSEIIKRLPEASAALTLFRRVTMSRAQQRLPVMSALPVAGFVAGDTGLKATTQAAWANKFLNAEEVAVIMPIAEAVLDDSAFDIWGETRPFLVEAIGRTIDAAIFFGTNKPASWPTDIVAAAVAAGNVVTAGTNTAATGGIVGDISQVFSDVETVGYDVNGVIAHRKFKGLLRQARGTTGEQLGSSETGGSEGIDPAPPSVYGVPIQYPLRGLWPTGAAAAELIAGDFSQGILGVRQDITYKVLDQAVIQDNTGAIQFNLAQQDMVALRVVMRVAWVLADTPTPESPSGGCPFAVLEAGATGP